MVCYLRKIGHFFGYPACWKCSHKGELLFRRITWNHWFCRTKWSDIRVKACSTKCLAGLWGLLTTKKRKALRRSVYHEEARRGTKPCRGLLTTKNHEEARSLAADCLPRRDTKRHEALRQIGISNNYGIQFRVPIKFHHCRITGWKPPLTHAKWVHQTGHPIQQP